MKERVKKLMCRFRTWKYHHLNSRILAYKIRKGTAPRGRTQTPKVEIESGESKGGHRHIKTSGRVVLRSRHYHASIDEWEDLGVIATRGRDA